MNLCIDQGNTRSKIGLFESDELRASFVVENFSADYLSEFIEHHAIEKAIFSTVRKDEAEIVEVLQKLPFFCEFTHETLLPVRNLYATPETLGKDRLAAVVGAFAIKPNHDILVIDAGTAITYDFLTASGDYLGGNIAPGISMRFSALHELTGKLPLVCPEGETPLLGKTTEEAIRGGVVNGVLYEILQYESELRRKYPQLSVFLTGGDCFFVAGKLKNPIFANPNLVLIGLNHILNFK